jgi:hypothetical protein
MSENNLKDSNTMLKKKTGRKKKSPPRVLNEFDLNRFKKAIFEELAELSNRYILLIKII